MFMAIKEFYSHMKPKTAMFKLGLFFSAFSTVLMILPARLFGYAIDNSVLGDKKSLLLPVLGVVVLIGLLKTSSRYIMILLFEYPTQHLYFNLRDKLYNKLQSLDASFYGSTTAGEIMAKMTGDLDMMRHFFAWIIYNSFEAVFLFTITLIYLSTINLYLTLLLLACAPFIFFLNKKMFGKLSPLFKKTREYYSELTQAVQENIAGNRIVKAFVREDYEITKMGKKNDDMRDINIKVTNTYLKFAMPTDFFTLVLSVIALAGGAYLVIKGKLSIGGLSIFTGLTWALNIPLKMSGNMINEFQRFSASVEKILPLYYANPQIKGPEHPVSKNKIEGNLSFNNVTLKINGKTILDKINLDIKKGETVAIIGPTGSGKTMLISLILRLFDATAGKIALDGIDIKKYSLKDLRSSIGVSAQDVFLFSNTIEGNIAYSNPDMNLEDIKNYANIAEADEFIKATPDGYGTIIGERGVGLSGGQKQRISLARAIATQAPILILDDTTSSVDMETEKRIQSSFENINNCTKIIIDQRISSVYNADKIIVLEKGKITETGTHNELKHSGGYYSRIYEMQHGDSEQGVNADGKEYIRN